MKDAGCEPVLVVTGAAGLAVRELIPAGAIPVHAADWAGGMSVSLGVGLRHLAELPDPPDAAVVGLVDMPDVSAEVVARLLRTAENPSTLARAAYDGRPGHPVLLGRDHWAGILAAASGDVGARNYLRGRDDVILVESGDLASGADIDAP